MVDAKYKSEKPEGFPNADIYQLLAYCTAYELRRGELVYAAGNEIPRVHRITGVGIEVTATALNLEQEPKELLAEIARLGETFASQSVQLTRRSCVPERRSDVRELASFRPAPRDR